MRANLIPLYFGSEPSKEFRTQLTILKELLAGEAKFLEPTPLGSKIQEADAVVFPELIGEIFRRESSLVNIKIPVLALTSEFGTVAMWDWEIVTFLRIRGIKVFTPYNLKLTKVICRALALKREMYSSKFLVFQDNPGDGMQASIFKRFYWWEEQCIKNIEDKFGVCIIKRSYSELAAKAVNISDSQAEQVGENLQINTCGVSKEQLNNAIKLYIAINNELDKYDSVSGVGINCLNESFFSNTTPCLAWDLLFAEKDIIWACEADILSLLTKTLVYKVLKVPVAMSNVYPFLMGMAALKHEKIDSFPNVNEPENCLLVAHCGYFACMPRPMADEWVLRPRVLEIVNKNAIAIDARINPGDVTLVEMHPTFKKILSVTGKLESYVQYENSDCRNGAVIRVNNGFDLMDKFYSHHACIAKTNISNELKLLAQVFEFDFESV